MKRKPWPPHERRRYVVSIATRRSLLCRELFIGARRTTVLFSAVEKHAQRSGDSPLLGRYEALQVPADDRRQRTLTKELNAYFDAVIAAVRRVESLLICGPGEAKGELRKQFEKKGLGARVAAVQTEDEMSDRQFAAKIHQYFTDSAHRAS